MQKPAGQVSLALVAALVGGALLGGCQRSRALETAPARRPNVVVILADDMGYGDPASFNADSRIPTPHIDRLAEEGTRFTDAHAPGAWCVPSRYGLLTGRYPCRKGAFRPGEKPVVAAERATLASFLKDEGYRTAMVGKWHLGFEGGPRGGVPLRGGPLDRGFDSFFGIHASLDIPPYFYIRDRRPVAVPSGTIEASGTEGWTNIQGAFWREGGLAPGFAHADVRTRFESEAVRVLREHDGDEPLFLYVALASPHTPWLPSRIGRSGAEMYGDFVADVDDTVGAIVAAADARGEETLVVFTSDNGPVWYPPDVARTGHASTGPYRGMKSDSWEGGHRMPFIARWRGRVPAGGRSDQLLCFTDLFATLAGVLGAELPTGAAVDSLSFLPSLLDPGAASTRRSLVLKANGSVVREGRWKLIDHLGSGGFSRPRRVDGEGGQLYDLELDPGETTNLWSERPDRVAQLLALREAELARE